MRIYVAGPMTGLPDYNLPAFAAATSELQSLGYDAVNPGRHGVIDGFGWQDYMRRGLGELLTCEAVALLPAWETSRGANLEVHVAKALNYPVRSIPDWVMFGEAS